MRIRYGRVAAAVGLVLLLPQVALWALSPVPAPLTQRHTVFARPCATGETVERAVGLYDGARIDLVELWSSWPVSPALAERVLAESERQRAAIAALRQAARCEQRTAVTTEPMRVLQLAELAAAEARLRGDEAAAVDLAELAFDLRDTGGLMHAFVGVAIAARALDTLEMSALTDPELGRRAQALAERPLELEPLLVRDAAWAYETLSAPIYVYRWATLPDSLLDELTDEWDATITKARRVGAARR